MKQKDKEVPVVKTLVVTTVPPVELREKRRSAFTEGELWASAPRATDSMQLFLGDVPKQYNGYVRITQVPQGIRDGGLLHLCPDGTVWVRDAYKAYTNSFEYREADKDKFEVGTWRLEFFESPNSDNEHGIVHVTVNNKEIVMMCKLFKKNNALRFALKPPYETDEQADAFNEERLRKERALAAAKQFVQVNIV